MDNTQQLMDPQTGGVFGYNAQCRARMLARHAQLLALLRAREIDIVRAHYDGCGDSGQLEPCECFTTANETVDCRLTDEERGQIDDHFYDLLECRHGGWENNDGGFGEFEWVVATHALTHDHNDYYTAYDTTVIEGLADIGVSAAPKGAP